MAMISGVTRGLTLSGSVHYENWESQSLCRMYGNSRAHTFV